MPSLTWDFGTYMNRCPKFGEVLKLGLPSLPTKAPIWVHRAHLSDLGAIHNQSHHAQLTIPVAFG
jgi:hypothetical protein